MSDAVSARPGARFDGFVQVREAGRVGMVTIRGDLGGARFKRDVKSVTGLDVPGQRAIIGDGPRLAWMSPDELLLFCDASEAPSQATALAQALAGSHALAVDVTDARAVFHIEGAACRDVLAKLTPADVAPRRFGPGELRRTRLAQVPAAFHMIDEACVEIVAFRSVAGYVYDLLANAARPGSETGLFQTYG